MIKEKSIFTVKATRLLPVLVTVVFAACQQPPPAVEYEPTWASLTQYPEAEWFHNAKFGIYTHWGVYAVPAYGNEWYPRWMYARDDEQNSHFYIHHVEHFGDPSVFGYKDFIPMFRAESFDAEEWAELFYQAGAQFAGPVGEHHDGFAMWDSDLTKWDAGDMGPQRDIMGELAAAIRKRGMRFVTSFHHAQRWWHFQESYDLENADTHDTSFAGVNGLYPPFHEKNARPTPEYLDFWEAKAREVIDKYRPDYLWFDFGWSQPEFEQNKRSLLAYYYNQASADGREVVVTYKNDHLPTGAGILDVERGKIDSLTTFKWITDTSISYNSWCYTHDLEYKTLNTLVDNLVDRVSKNGNLLLNIAPRSDGTIPDEQKELLLGIGGWLKVNGEAIYGTRPWITYGEGPTQHTSGQFTERGIEAYNAEDIRFTRKGEDLFVIVLDWPESGMATVRSLDRGQHVSGDKINTISLLGSEETVEWTQDGSGIYLSMPAGTPQDEAAYVFKIQLNGSL